MVKKSIFFIWFIFLFILVNKVLSFPPVSTEFYGTITYYNNPLSAGETVFAYYGNNSCGSFVTNTDGYYGLLSCNGDDPTTIEIEGGQIAQNINFFVGSFEADEEGNNTWTERTFKQVNLYVPVLNCGDNFCDSRESCFSCEIDCGNCNATSTTNTTTNTTGNTSGGGGDETSGGDDNGNAGSGSTSNSVSGGGGAGGSNIQYGDATVGENYFDESVLFVDCTEDWTCSEWTKCTSDELQYRRCTDNNYCGSFQNKPAEKRGCIYFGEELPEEGPPSEKKKRPLLERPFDILLPKIECTKEINIFKNGGIWFFLAIILLIGIRIWQLENKLDKIRHKKNKGKKDDDMKKAQLIFSEKRRTYIFIGVISFLSIIVYLFYVFFFLCEINFAALLTLLGTTIIFPFIVHKVIDLLEYNEHEKIVRLAEFADTHYHQIQTLIDIENDTILDMEKELSEKFEELSERQSFQKIMKENPALDKIYKEIVVLFEEYASKKILIRDEQELVNDINVLSENPSFGSLMEKSDDVRMIYDKLSLLYTHYEEKQQLYGELIKAEEDLREKLKEEEKNSELK